MCEKWQDQIPWILNCSHHKEDIQAFRDHLPCPTCEQVLEETHLAWRVFDAHPPLELICSMAFKELDLKTSSEIREHFLQCPDCRVEFQLAQSSSQKMQKKTPWMWALAATLLIAASISFWISKKGMDGSQIQVVDLFPENQRSSQSSTAVFQGSKQVLMLLYPSQHQDQWTCQIWSKNPREKLDEMVLISLSDGSLSLFCQPNWRKKDLEIILISAEFEERFQVNWDDP